MENCRAMIRIKLIKSFFFSRTFSVITFLLVFGFISSCSALRTETQNKQATQGRWTGTWACSPQLVESHNKPPEPGLSGNTIRQIFKVSIGGDSLKIRFSNVFSTSSVVIKKAMLAVSYGDSSIDISSQKQITFDGNETAILQPGTTMTSDPFAFKLLPRMSLAVTLYFGETSADVTGHPGSRTTSYILKGDQTASIDFTGSVHTDHWYIINGVDVRTAANSAAIVVIGNSITDGRGSGTNKQNRWPDILAERLIQNPSTSNIAVLNHGIGGNCVLKPCLGPSALDRFERDVLNQTGVKWVIVLEGINDIGGIQSSETADSVAQDLITAYGKMIDAAHAKGIKVYGATIAPFGKSFYDKDFRQQARSIVNQWIRTSGRFDAVIDFDKLLENPEEPLTILPNAHTGDFLHPNEYGYQLMGESIDLKLFEDFK